MPTIPRTLISLGVTLLMFTTSACGSHSYTPAITIDQANQMVEDYLAQGLSVLSPHAHMSRISVDLGGEFYRRDHLFCYDHATEEPSKPTDPVSATRSGLVLGLDPAKSADYFQALRTWWATNNFHINHDSQQPEIGRGYLDAENRADEFKMTLKMYDASRFYLGVDSACAIPTPEKNGTIGQAVSPPG